MTSPLLCVLIVVAMATCTASQNYVPRMFIPRGDASGVRVTFPGNDDRGVVENCGPTGLPFSMYWIPKALNPEGKVTLYYNVTAPKAFSQGKGSLKLFLMDEPEPIIEVDQVIDCAHAKKYAPTLQCPVKKGEPIVGTIEQRKLDPLAGYEGDYRLELSLKNEKQQMILCGRMNVTII